MEVRLRLDHKACQDGLSAQFECYLHVAKLMEGKQPDLARPSHMDDILSQAASVSRAAPMTLVLGSVYARAVYLYGERHYSLIFTSLLARTAS